MSSACGLEGTSFTAGLTNGRDVHNAQHPTSNSQDIQLWELPAFACRATADATRSGEVSPKRALKLRAKAEELEFWELTRAKRDY